MKRQYEQIVREIHNIRQEREDDWFATKITSLIVVRINTLSWGNVIIVFHFYLYLNLVLPTHICNNWILNIDISFSTHFLLLLLFPWGIRPIFLINPLYLIFKGIFLWFLNIFDSYNIFLNKSIIYFLFWTLIWEGSKCHGSIFNIRS